MSTRNCTSLKWPPTKVQAFTIAWLDCQTSKVLAFLLVHFRVVPCFWTAFNMFCQNGVRDLSRNLFLDEKYEISTPKLVQNNWKSNRISDWFLCKGTAKLNVTEKNMTNIFAALFAADFCIVITTCFEISERNHYLKRIKHMLDHVFLLTCFIICL